MFQPLTFEEDPVFTEKALRLIGDDGIFAIQMFLYDRPDAGDIIPGSGGCRKIRWAAKGHGKRGGSRVIYYWITEDNRILLLDIYAKNERENPSLNRIRELNASYHENQNFHQRHRSPSYQTADSGRILKAEKKCTGARRASTNESLSNFQKSRWQPFPRRAQSGIPAPKVSHCMEVHARSHEGASHSRSHPGSLCRIAGNRHQHASQLGTKQAPTLGRRTDADPYRSQSPRSPARSRRMM